MSSSSLQSSISRENNNENNCQNRGQNALQRRQLQLKRWHELMQNEAKESAQRPLANSRVEKTRVQFSSATLFLSAVAQNDVEECERLLRTTGDGLLDVNATTGDGLTALHQMAIDDNLDMCRWLLEHRADVNCKDNEGWTPLHASASCGHLEIVRLLLSRDELDVFAVTSDGELARDVCDGEECLRAIEERMKRDLSSSRDFSTEDDSDDGLIPEVLLTEMRRKELKQIESDFKEFLNQMFAQNAEKQIRDWIERTRDPQSRATVLHVCAAKGYNECLSRILETIHETSVDIDAFTDCDGFTALHAAAFWQQMTTFDTLLRFGANFELKTRDSRLVSDLCHENPKILELMSETKKSRELEAMSEKTQSASETQRKLNAKRQRESRRPTQGVSKEDIEMALKTTLSDQTVITSLPSTSPPMPSSPPPTIITAQIPAPPLVDLTPPHASFVVPARRRPKRRSTGIDDNLNLIMRGNDAMATSGVETTDGDECVDSVHKIILSLRGDDALNSRKMSSFGSWRTTPNPRSVSSRHPSSASPALSRSLTSLPFGSSSSSSSMPFITTAPAHQISSPQHRRQPHLNRRPTGQPSAPNRLRASSQSSLYSNTSSSSPLNTIFTNPSTTQSRSRSSSRSSVGDTTGDDSEGNGDDNNRTSEREKRERGGVVQERKEEETEVELDYKKLYKELLKENEFLIKKIKDFENNRKYEKEFQEFQREKRQLVRRVSELEEELKQKEDLLKENLRLKDENSALIRVISKLSK